MNERFATLMTARDQMLGAAQTLRRIAAAEKPAPEPSRPAGLDPERTRNTFEDLAASGLAKTAEIDAAIEHIGKDPNRILDVLRNVGEIALNARKAAAEATAADAPGTLVGKIATAAPSKRSSMSELFAEQSRAVDARIAGRRSR